MIPATMPPDMLHRHGTHVDWNWTPIAPYLPVGGACSHGPELPLHWQMCLSISLIVGWLPQFEPRVLNSEPAIEWGQQSTEWGQHGDHSGAQMPFMQDMKRQSSLTLILFCRQYTDQTSLIKECGSLRGRGLVGWLFQHFWMFARFWCNIIRV